jgi:hypothetical protein
MDVLADNVSSQIDELKSAADSLKQYCEEAIPLVPISEDEIGTIVAAEIGQGAIMLDNDGLISGARNILYARIKTYLQDFEKVRQAFNAKFQPFQGQITIYEAIPATIAKLAADGEAEIAELKRALDNDRVGEDYRNDKARYDDQLARHAHRPNMKAVSVKFPFDVNPIYLVIMLLLGTAEWFINYDTLFEFFGIPIIAIGATLILALCLAVIAHQHGVDLKQWKKKFGPGVENKNRPYGVFLLATAGLIGLITVTGWMRFQSLESVIQSQSGANIIGTQYTVQIDPEREVIISLGANALAWLVGVFISYFAHDPDPTYVHTAVDFLKAEKKFKKKKAEFDKEANRIRHNYKEKIEEENRRQRKFETSDTLRDAINSRDQADRYEAMFNDRAKAFFLIQYGRFRSELLRALQSRTGISIFKSEKGTAVPISIKDFQALPFGISEEQLANKNVRGNI